MNTRKRKETFKNKLMVSGSLSLLYSLYLLSFFNPSIVFHLACPGNHSRIYVNMQSFIMKTVYKRYVCKCVKNIFFQTKTN